MNILFLISMGFFGFTVWQYTRLSEDYYAIKAELEIVSGQLNDVRSQLQVTRLQLMDALFELNFIQGSLAPNYTDFTFELYPRTTPYFYFAVPRGRVLDYTLSFESSVPVTVCLLDSAAWVDYWRSNGQTLRCIERIDGTRGTFTVKLKADRSVSVYYVATLSNKQGSITFNSRTRFASPTSSTTPTSSTPGGSLPSSGIPLTIDTRWGLRTAFIVVHPDGSIEYRVPPVKLMAYGGSPGLAGYTWGKPTGGCFPPSGITIDPLTGVLHGTGGALPEPGTYDFDVEVSDGTSTATATFTIRVERIVRNSTMDPVPLLEFQQPLMDTIQLPSAKAGQPYGATLRVVGGRPPYSWSLD